MTDEEIHIRATYPANTVYLHYDKSGHVNGAQPYDFYAERKKTYSDCCEALKKSTGDCYRERQDSDLYELAKLYQKRVRETAEYSSIKYVLENTIADLQDVLDDMEENEEDE